MSKKVIVVTLCRRPDYTAQLFEALRACHGIEDYTILISCDVDERYREESRQVVDDAKAFLEEHEREHGQHENALWVNDPRLGIDSNKMFVLPKAFKLTDYVIFMEDDTIPAPDTLRFFEWVDAEFKDDPKFISATGYHRYLTEDEHNLNLDKHLYTANKSDGFCPWLWAMHKDRYERFMGDGKAYEERWGVEVNGRFDWWFNELTKTNPGCYSIFPIVPRSNHVGAHGAEHTPSAEFLYENEFAPYGAWSQECPDPGNKPWKKHWEEQ